MCKTYLVLAYCQSESSLNVKAVFGTQITTKNVRETVKDYIAGKICAEIAVQWMSESVDEASSFCDRKSLIDTAACITRVRSVSPSGLTHAHTVMIYVCVIIGWLDESATTMEC